MSLLSRNNGEEAQYCSHRMRQQSEEVKCLCSEAMVPYIVRKRPCADAPVGDSLGTDSCESSFWPRFPNSLWQ